jgi:bifunctional ADP-heptose synthase (sugar kinase/adenylyltransferase)
LIDTRNKIVSADAIEADGEATVVAFGRFDVIRAEHCRILRDARRDAGRLIAAVLADVAGQSSLFDQQSRAQLTAALADVALVVICAPAEVEQLAARAGAATVDVDAMLKRDLVADVLQRQSAKA